MKYITNEYFKNFRPHELFSKLFTLKDISLLKSFSRKNDNIVICKPDKGRGVVIIDKETYISKLKVIISDSTKFRLVTEDLLVFSRRIEDRVNRFLSKILKLDIIDDINYRKLYASGTGPGILYGLPKIHKLNFTENFHSGQFLLHIVLLVTNCLNFWFPF